MTRPTFAILAALAAPCAPPSPTASPSPPPADAAPPTLPGVPPLPCDVAAMRLRSLGCYWPDAGAMRCDCLAAAGDALAAVACGASCP